MLKKRIFQQKEIKFLERSMTRTMTIGSSIMKYAVGGERSGSNFIYLTKLQDLKILSEQKRIRDKLEKMLKPPIDTVSIGSFGNSLYGENCTMNIPSESWAAELSKELHWLIRNILICAANSGVNLQTILIVHPTPRGDDTHSYPTQVNYIDFTMSHMVQKTRIALQNDPYVPKDLCIQDYQIQELEVEYLIRALCLGTRRFHRAMNEKLEYLYHTYVSRVMYHDGIHYQKASYVTLKRILLGVFPKYAYIPTGFDQHHDDAINIFMGGKFNKEFPPRTKNDEEWKGDFELIERYKKDGLKVPQEFPEDQLRAILIEALEEMIHAGIVNCDSQRLNRFFMVNRPELPHVSGMFINYWHSVLTKYYPRTLEKLQNKIRKISAEMFPPVSLESMNVSTPTETMDVTHLDQVDQELERLSTQLRNLKEKKRQLHEKQESESAQNILKDRDSGVEEIHAESEKNTPDEPVAGPSGITAHSPGTTAPPLPPLETLGAIPKLQRVVDPHSKSRNLPVTGTNGTL